MTATEITTAAEITDQPWATLYFQLTTDSAFAHTCSWTGLISCL